MAAFGLMVLLFLLLFVGSGVLLYWLVRSEHDQRVTLDRDHAERSARRDRPDQDGS